MNPTTLAQSCATSNSLLVIALCMDSSRPESGFQLNHSDRRPSTAGASMVTALLTVKVLGHAHHYPSRMHASRPPMNKVLSQPRKFTPIFTPFCVDSGPVELAFGSGFRPLGRSSLASSSQEHPRLERHRREARRGSC